MAKFIETDGDIFESGADILVNPVNCVGVMGGGLALKFKQRYPQMFKAYYDVCYNRLLKPGDIFAHFVHGDHNDPYIILSAATKDDWRNPSQYSYVDSIFVNIQRWSERYPILAGYKIALPALGCGLGGLDYEHIRPYFEGAVDRWQFDEAIVYRPH